ncbi:MAG: hypothetical protein ACXVRV_15885 [Gaiellaceae bacterium]
MTESTLPSPRSRLAALIAGARRRGRRRKLALALIALLALLVGGGIWATLELTGGGGGAAAVNAPPGFHIVQSQGPVVRRVFETWTPSQPVSVDVATGTERPVRTTTAIWYDTRGDLNRVVTRADGRVQHDDAFACPRSVPRPCVDWPFAFKNYWPLDLSRYTRQPGIGTFHGRPVIWIAPRQAGGFAAPPGFGERIGLDPRTHAPVADRTYDDGKIGYEILVLERKPDIAAGKYSFVVPNPTKRRPPTNPTPELSARGSNPYALRARRALGQRPLWLGERFDGNRLQAVTIGSTFEPPTGDSTRAVRQVLYDYGNVAIIEFNARDLQGARGASLPGRMTLEPGFAELSRGGVLVGVSPSQHGNYVLDRAAALRVARALRPVPLR